MSRAYLTVISDRHCSYFTLFFPLVMCAEVRSIKEAQVLARTDRAPSGAEAAVHVITKLLYDYMISIRL